MHVRLTPHSHARLLPHGYRMLEQAGNFNNLRLAIGQDTGNYSSKYPFLSD
jgi:hypothetical protein